MFRVNALQIAHVLLEWVQAMRIYNVFDAISNEQFKVYLTEIMKKHKSNICSTEMGDIDLGATLDITFEVHLWIKNRLGDTPASLANKHVQFGTLS